jgi:hypothetical protein
VYGGACGGVIIVGRSSTIAFVLDAPTKRKSFSSE